MLNNDRNNKGEAGFTRTELMALVGTALLLFLWALPLLANNKARSELMGCLNNLRLIGQAAQQWGNEHYGWTPWRTPWAYGGTMPDGTDPWRGMDKPGAAWFEMASFSNQLVSPKFLVCPSDEGKRVAGTWSLSDAEQGFLNYNFRDNALSYFVGLETIPWWPRGIVAGDRNLRYDFQSAGCSARVRPVAWLRTPRVPNEPGTANWTNAIHGEVGNLLFNDGSVERHSRETFRKTLSFPDDNGTIHFLPPR
jgi:prepilin-type processing-associated H-X9-DG protein